VDKKKKRHCRYNSHGTKRRGTSLPKQQQKTMIYQDKLISW
jgi:hypothetical protein